MHLHFQRTPGSSVDLMSRGRNMQEEDRQENVAAVMTEEIGS